MPINFTTPTIAPPSADEVVESEISPTAIAAPGQPGGTGLGQQHEAFLSDWMQTPSRWDIPMVQQGVDLANREFESGFEQGKSLLDEHISQRGLVGSDIEGANVGNLISQLNNQRAGRLFDLNTRMADTYGQDRAAAATAATQYGQLGLGQGELGLGYAQLGQQGSQFDAGLQFQRDELMQRMGMTQQQLDLDREEMHAEFGDRQAQRLHQMGLQESDQNFSRIQNALNRELEVRALENQRYGIDKEEAWRMADRDLEEQLQERSLALQERGLTEDAAYRAAALQLQAESAEKDRALSLFQTQTTSANQRYATDMSAMAQIIDSLNRWAAGTGASSGFGFQDFLSGFNQLPGGGTTTPAPDFSNWPTWGLQQPTEYVPPGIT